jgi:hypothetical protein
MKKGKNPKMGFRAKQNLKTPPTNDNLASFQFFHQDKIDFCEEILYNYLRVVSGWSLVVSYGLLILSY